MYSIAAYFEVPQLENVQLMIAIYGKHVNRIEKAKIGNIWYTIIFARNGKLKSIRNWKFY